MPTSPARVRFGVIGVNHNHIYEMTELLRHAGSDLCGFYAAEDDPAAALAYAQAYPYPERRNGLMWGVVHAWAKQDWHAALAWAQQLPAGQLQNKYLQSIAAAAADSDPQAALALARFLRVAHANLRGAAVSTSPVLGVPVGSISNRCTSSFATGRCSTPFGTMYICPGPSVTVRSRS